MNLGGETCGQLYRHDCPLDVHFVYFVQMSHNNESPRIKEVSTSSYEIFFYIAG